ncbi:MAG: radical SAM protein [Bacteriovoracaceae bacterium]|nr:radical SAM protein [Bacteriovoracaceae bacterium]
MYNVNIPFGVQFEITDRCNYKCPHCFNFSQCDFYKGFSNDLNKKEVLEVAKKIVEEGFFAVNITGGEPFCRPDVLDELIAYFLMNKIFVSLNTNLSILNEEIVNKFKKNKLSGLLVSCPSLEPLLYKQMTGGGDLCNFKNNLCLLIKSHIGFSVNMVVNKSNIGKIRETAEGLNELGVTSFGATPMAYTCKSNFKNKSINRDDVRFVIEELTWIHKKYGMKVDIFMSLPKCIFPEEIRRSDLGFLKRSCQAGRAAMTISCNGDVRPCSHSEQTYGNILHEPASEIYLKMAAWREGAFIPKDCDGCAVVYKCFGGCRESSLAINGKINSNDSWMISPIKVDTFAKNSHKTQFFENNVIDLTGEIRYRIEGDYFAVCTKAKNISLINKELFLFLKELEDLCPITIKSLSTKLNVLVDDVCFRNIIRGLIERNLVSIDE